MTDAVDKVNFQDLARLEPADVRRRSGCSPDRGETAYAVPVWDDTFVIYPDQYRVDFRQAYSKRVADYFSLFTVHYLLTATERDLKGEWVSEKDIPGGAAFFRGPHEIPTHLIVRGFGNNLDAFRQRCTGLGGTPLDMGDAAFTFDITPRIPVAVLYWIGDDEFPAEAKILYDRSIQHHLALDIIYALAVGVCERLAAEV